MSRPKHEVIKFSLLGRISAEEWPVGSRFPSEHDLAREFDVSRVTIQRVMRELVVAGVIDRVIGSGSYVTRHIVRSSFVRLDDLTEFEQSEKGTREIVMRRLLRKKQISNSPILYLAIRWTRGGSGSCAERWLINLAGGRTPDSLCERDISVIDWLHELHSIDRIEERCQVAVPVARAEKELNIAARRPRITMSRRFYSNGRWVGSVKETNVSERSVMLRRYSTIAALPTGLQGAACAVR